MCHLAGHIVVAAAAPGHEASHKLGKLLTGQRLAVLKEAGHCIQGCRWIDNQERRGNRRRRRRGKLVGLSKIALESPQYLFQRESFPLCDTSELYAHADQRVGGAYCAFNLHSDAFHLQNHSGNAYPYGLVVGDFNHDQHPDIAVANEDGPNVGILLNDGTGGFLTVTNYSMAHNVYEIAAGDMNGDGYLDLLLPLYNSNSVALLLGNTDNSGTFQAESDIALVNGNATYYDPFGIKVADLNGDGNLDFATTAYGSQGIVVALGKGDGTFNTPNLYSVTNQDFAAFLSPSPIGVDAADINGDGKVDLVYSNSSFSTVGVLFGNGDGTFGTPHEYPTGNDPYFFALGDVNGDGAVDVVAPSYIVHEVTVLLNANGSGVQSSFTVGITTPTATVTAGSPATYDMALTGNNGYNGTVTFSCSGLPAHAACSFAPSSIVASGAAQSVAITITTTAATASLTQPALPNSKPAAPSLWASLGGLGIFGLVLAAETKKRNRRNMAIVLGILLVVMSFALVGCGSSSSSGPSGSAGTPAGTYTVVVTATGTGNAPAHSMNLTLTVQ